MSKSLRNFLYYFLIITIFLIYSIFVLVIMMYIYDWLGIPKYQYNGLKKLGASLVLLIFAPLFRPVSRFLQIKVKKDMMFKD